MGFKKHSTLCSATDIFHLTLRGKTGKFSITDFYRDPVNKLNWSQASISTLTVECSLSGSLHLNSCVYFRQGVENGVPAYVCDPAASHHIGNAVHCYHGEGSIHIWGLIVDFYCITS